MRNVLILPFVSLFLSLPATAQHDHGAKPVGQSKPVAESKPPAKTWTTSDAYPLDTCVVSGHPFATDELKLVEVEGRTIKLCSAECAEKLQKDPQDYLAKLDQAVAETQLADYPLETCPISGKPLGSMGEPVKLVLDNHLVQLCCKGCTAKAKASKDDIVRSIEVAAYAKQKDDYPLKTCLNTGEVLDPKHTIEVMHGPTLLRFCCKDCIDDLDKAPSMMLGQLQAARKPQAPGESKKPATGQPPQKPGEHEGHGKKGQDGGHDGHGAAQGSGETGHGRHGGCGGSSGGSSGGRSRGGCGRDS